MSPKTDSCGHSAPDPEAALPYLEAPVPVPCGVGLPAGDDAVKAGAYEPGGNSPHGQSGHGPWLAAPGLPASLSEPDSGNDARSNEHAVDVQAERADADSVAWRAGKVGKAVGQRAPAEPTQLRPCAPVVPVQLVAARLATPRAAVLSGRLTIEQLVDRYGVRQQGVRQLLIDYLERRKAELDYSSLEQLSRKLVGLFWAKVEKLAPVQADLRLDVELYQRWRRAPHPRGRTRPPRRHRARPAVCPLPLHRPTHLGRGGTGEVGALGGLLPGQRVPNYAASTSANAAKGRMDDRVRRRQPLLPTLVAHLEDRYGHL